MDTATERTAEPSPTLSPARSGGPNCSATAHAGCIPVPLALRERGAHRRCGPHRALFGGLGDEDGGRRVLADSLTTGEEALAGALRQYEDIRPPRVEQPQDAAVRSQRWWDSIGHRLDLPAPQLMLAYLSRGGVTASRLAGSDPALRTQASRHSPAWHPPKTSSPTSGPGSCTSPTKGHRCASRVLAEDGQEGYREVPGEPSAVAACARPIRTNLLAAVLRTDADDPRRRRRRTRCSTAASLSPRPGAEQGAGRPGRAALLDRLALAERIRCQTKLFTVVGAPPATSTISSTRSWPPRPRRSRRRC